MSDCKDYKVKLKLVNSWIKSYPNKLREVPKELISKITNERAMALQIPYREHGGKLTLSGLNKIKKDILERMDKECRGFWDRFKSVIIILASLATIIIFFLMLLESPIKP